MARYVLKKNLKATMIVPSVRNEKVEMINFEGQFSGFDRLAAAVENSSFFRLKDEYSTGDSDPTLIAVSVVRKGKSKSVRDFGGACPSNCLAVQNLIRSQMNLVEWKEHRQKQVPKHHLRRKPPEPTED
jgi:hypothetical protein